MDMSVMDHLSFRVNTGNVTDLSGVCDHCNSYSKILKTRRYPKEGRFGPLHDVCPSCYKKLDLELK